jgi:hypothetical protein
MDAGSFGAIFGTLIPVVAIGGGITYAILSSYWKHKTQFAKSSGTDELRAALDANTQASKAIVDRLDAIDARLSTVEKTLTDIP